jgi:predicted AAA+ superfamily ATPase
MERKITRIRGNLSKYLKPGRVTALYGARRVGKT